LIEYIIVSQGINENVRYKGRVFHVQTEERGGERPVLVCTLFYGGVILSEERLTYQDILNSDRFQEMVKQLRMDIHRRMVENLKKGLYDEKIESFPESEGASGRASSDEEDTLENLFRSYLLPSLNRELKTDLPEHEVLAISEKIPYLKGGSEKERYLSLCAEIYSRVKDRCDKEAFKSLVKRWSAEIRFHAGAPRGRFP